MSFTTSSVNSVRLNDHFKIATKELKTNPVLQEHLARELPLIIKAIAKNEKSITVDGTRFDLQNLKRKDLVRLMKVANKVFSMENYHLLDNDLLESLYKIGKTLPGYTLSSLINRTEAVLTMNHASSLEVEESAGTVAVRKKIEEASENIKKVEKTRKKAKIISIACAAGAVIGLGLFIGGVAVLTGGALVAALIIGLTGVGFSGIAGTYYGSLAARTGGLSEAEEKHAYWTHVLTFSQTEEFQLFKQLNEGFEGLDTDSIDFLEAAALVHLKSQGILDHIYHYSPLEKYRLKDLEKTLGRDFQEQSKAYLFSKEEKFNKLAEQYSAPSEFDPAFIRLIYLESLDNHDRHQKTEHKQLKKTFKKVDDV